MHRLPVTRSRSALRIAARRPCSRLKAFQPGQVRHPVSQGGDALQQTQAVWRTRAVFGHHQHRIEEAVDRRDHRQEGRQEVVHRAGQARGGFGLSAGRRTGRLPPASTKAPCVHRQAFLQVTRDAHAARVGRQDRVPIRRAATQASSALDRPRRAAPGCRPAPPGRRRPHRSAGPARAAGCAAARR